jgi:putative acetyltransferase
MTIIEDGLDDPRVIDLLRLHVERGRAETAPSSAHAFDPARLNAPDIRFWTVWREDELLGCAALKQLASHHGEIKSMHIIEGARRRGVGSTLLNHIIEQARHLGMTRLSLETGSWPYFHAARELYRRHGFVECRPFDGYVEDENSVFMTRETFTRSDGA